MTSQSSVTSVIPGLARHYARTDSVTLASLVTQLDRGADAEEGGSMNRREAIEELGAELGPRWRGALEALTRAQEARVLAEGLPAGGTMSSPGGRLCGACASRGPRRRVRSEVLFVGAWESPVLLRSCSGCGLLEVEPLDEEWDLLAEPIALPAVAGAPQLGLFGGGA